MPIDILGILSTLERDERFLRHGIDSILREKRMFETGDFGEAVELCMTQTDARRTNKIISLRYLLYIVTWSSENATIFRELYQYRGRFDSFKILEECVLLHGVPFETMNHNIRPT